MVSETIMGSLIGCIFLWDFRSKKNLGFWYYDYTVDFMEQHVNLYKLNDRKYRDREANSYRHIYLVIANLSRCKYGWV